VSDPASVRPARKEDLAAVRQFLGEAGLPDAGVEEWLPQFIVAEHQGRIVGVAGLELYGPSALLRSVAVRAEYRGGGLGRALVDRLLIGARERGTRDVYLLTTTAESWFPRLGFAPITRDEVPEAVRRSVEFTSACPTSATVMRKSLARRVLFVCTGNSARSQMAEAVLNHRAGGRYLAESAGSEPAVRVHPYAVEVLRGAGIAWQGHQPRALVGLEREPWDLVITVCDHARESCPVFLGNPVVAHWGIPDPAAVQGDEATRRAAFVDAFVLIGRRVDQLLEGETSA
jgi:N-acetylglutamate synthase-like GNAT family acetyltransferase/protein-tyrosine-phosphatase